MHTLTRPNYSLIAPDILVERIRQLEEEVGLGLEFHPCYNLTASEAVLLGVIAAGRPVCSKDHAYTVIYGMHDDPPEQKILDVFVCKLRRKLEPLGITIHTMWGRGWYLEDEDKAKVDLMRFQPPTQQNAAA